MQKTLLGHTDDILAIPESNFSMIVTIAVRNSIDRTEPDVAATVEMCMT